MECRKQKYYFTDDHEWIRFENNIAFVGLTKNGIGSKINIEIHTVGKDLKENEVVGMIRTKKY